MVLKYPVISPGRQSPQATKASCPSRLMYEVSSVATCLASGAGELAVLISRGWLKLVPLLLDMAAQTL